VKTSLVICQVTSLICVKILYVWRARQEGPKQANYINALAVSVLPFFEPAKGTLGGFFFPPWVDFL
jgi:hypothetical protein